ncbi:MAG: T9SS type A sorting domain-containing protein [Winogradskyella arenosi]
MKTKLLYLLLFISSYSFSQIYVNQNATGYNDGSSWADAYVDLQSAIASMSAGDEIWIAGGTYKPSTANRGIYYRINKPNISIYGGFAGTETLINDRVLGANETILSGDLQGNDVNVSGFSNNYVNTTRSDNTYRVIAIDALGDHLLLDGLTISDAHNNYNDTSPGAAILKNSSVENLTLRNCTIKDNVARTFSAGVHADFNLSATNNRGSLTIDRCQFTNNMSLGGSGVYTLVSASTNLDVTISNNVFDNNLAADLIASSAFGVSGSSMWFRVAGNGSDATLNVYNNTFVNNIDTGTGTGIIDDRFRAPLAISENGSISSNIVGIVANCIFWNNTGLNDALSTGGLTRAISDTFEYPITSLNVYNCLDALDFVEGSITSAVNTVTTNPLFASLINGDYSLTTGSPALDSGNNSYVFGSEDILGHQRIFNTTIDMGAIEFGSSLGINDFSIAENQVKLYPNPASSVLNIEMTQDYKQATIYSVLGKEVLSTQNKNINISGLSNGVFLIKIEDENGNVSTKRFIKQ